MPRLRPHALVFVCACLVASVASVASAGDTWTQPFPGLLHLHRTTSDPLNINVLKIDLCSPGISLRGTRPALMGRRTSTFARTEGVQAAVNAGFFNTANYQAIGLTMGAGERWLSTADDAGTGLVAFGRDNKVLLSMPEAIVEPPLPWMRDTVATIGVLLRDGRVLQDTAIDHLTTRQPRTGIGLSADRTQLFLAVVDGRRPGVSIGVTTADFGRILLGLGAYNALNLDGGGSSTAWLQGRGVLNFPTDAAGERIVSNHLGVFARDASGEPSLCCRAKAVPAGSAIFRDLPTSHWGYAYAAGLRAAGVTMGCSASPPLFCPDCRMRRADLAVMLLRALRVSPLDAPAATFADVPRGHPAFGAVERLRALGITSGCSASPRLFCPDESVTRAQAALLLARALRLGSVHPARATFVDVAASRGDAGAIEALARQCVVSGCSSAPRAFCPDRAATRMEIGAMIARAFGLGVAARCRR